MTIEALRKLYDSQPFSPFVIHLADGRKFPVEHREFLALGPRGRTVIVYQLDESFDVLDLMLVTGFQVKAGASQDGGSS
jgi:hypothetical protein